MHRQSELAIMVGMLLILSTAFYAIPLPSAFAQEKEDVDFVTNIEYIKGHLEQAIANKNSGNNELAIAHSDHPISEVYTLIQQEIAEKDQNLESEIRAGLEALPESVNSDSETAFAQKITNINKLLDQAVDAVISKDDMAQASFHIGVISNLLETAEHEYEEGVEGGEVKEMIEYQDAQGFISRANAGFMSIQSQLPEHEAEEINEFFEQLDSSIQAKASSSTIETIVDGIVHEFSESVSGAADEHVEFAANIEFIKGHLAQAVANKNSNNTELAKAHAGHPIAEVYSLIEGEIEEHNATLSESLENALATLMSDVDSLDATAFQSKVGEINSMLDNARSSVISPEESQDPKFNGMVAITVLETAEHEYEEGVEGGEVKEMIEYQDSTAFIARAEAIFKTIQSQLPEHEAEEINEFFEQLGSLTKSTASFEQVETVIDGIIHEFEEALELEQGESSDEELDGWGYIDRIQDLLDQSVAEYKEGNMQEAKRLATMAYLDNYEFIEGDIEEDNKGLMTEIEQDMRVKLLGMIDDQKPASEIESHVDGIKTKLETARAVVTPEFPVAIIVMASLVAIIIVAGRFSGALQGRAGTGGILGGRR